MQPLVVVAKEVNIGSGMAEQIPVRVHGEFEIVALDGTPDGLAVEIHNHGRCRAEENPRWIGLYPRRIFRHDLALVQIRKNPVERDHAIVRGHRVLDRRHDFPHLLFLQRLKVGLGDLQLLEADETLGEGDARLSLEFDRAECRLLVRRTGLVGHGAVCDQMSLTIPARDLRLRDDDDAAARKIVGTWPAAVDRRLCCRRRLGCGRRLGEGSRGSRERREWLCEHSERGDSRNDLYRMLRMGSHVRFLPMVV